MTTAGDHDLVVHVRRLASDGKRLYLRIGVTDVARLKLEHGQRLEIDMDGRARVRGIVKTSGGSPWLAPGPNSSNAGITAMLRQAGFEHGDDVPARIHVQGYPEVPTVSGASTASSAVPTSRSPHLRGGLRFDAQTAIHAVHAYNEGRYRGRLNVDVDHEGYERFRGGLPDDEPALVELLRFVGESYGGAQRRFLPHGFREEAALIVVNLLPVLDQYRIAVATARPLVESIPEEATLAFLLAPFAGTMRWPVWASKTLHFLRPDAFPILDSRAKKALGMTSLSNSPRGYCRFCATIRDVLTSNRAALAAARNIDNGTSPSDLKLLDKILYQLGE